MQFGWSTVVPLREKTDIIKDLGVNELLLPKLVSDALAANDRTKYLLALLQAAKNNADNPQIEVSNLKTEREESGVEDTSFDTVVELSSKKSNNQNSYYIAEADRLIRSIIENINIMILPLRRFSQRGTENVPRKIELSFQDKDRTQAYNKLIDRFEAQISKIPNFEDCIISGSFIDDMTSGKPKGGDGFHLVIMGVHKELNKLQSLIYSETVDSARVYEITESDKILVRAFMKGVTSTELLKFEHPGLETTATRSGDTLLIQNNIGTTDAHILILKVRGTLTTVTYSDIHIQRIEFFRSLFEQFQINWHDTGSQITHKIGEESAYHLSVGTFAARNEKDLENYLSFLGSRLVFLIDWNRARKCIRNFLKRKDCIKLLKWSADNNIGHRAFLKMGGEQLIFGALEKTMKSPLKFGDRFDQVIGPEIALEFLKFVLRTCTEGLLQNRSEFLIRDEVRAELAKYLRSADENLLQMAANHATLIVEISTTVRDGLLHIEDQDLKFVKRNAVRTEEWEREADALLNSVRLTLARSRKSPVLESLVSNADDAADSLEETLFLMTLVSRNDIVGNFFEPLLELAELAVDSSMEYLKAIENSKILDKGSTREEIDDFLRAVDRIITIEHNADDLNRTVSSSIMKNSSNFKQLHILDKISDLIESATDSLMKSALIIKNYTLEEIISL